MNCVNFESKLFKYPKTTRDGSKHKYQNKITNGYVQKFQSTQRVAAKLKAAQTSWRIFKINAKMINSFEIAALKYIKENKVE